MIAMSAHEHQDLNETNITFGHCEAFRARCLGNLEGRLERIETKLDLLNNQKRSAMRLGAVAALIAGLLMAGAARIPWAEIIKAALSSL
jgi:hypothetical protein